MFVIFAFAAFYKKCMCVRCFCYVVLLVCIQRSVAPLVVFVHVPYAVCVCFVTRPKLLATAARNVQNNKPHVCV